MARLQGSQTEKNLLAAFSGESQARTRYTFFSKVAKKEGYEQISAIFLETAENEKEHAKRFFRFLEGGMVEVTATFPAGVIGSTLDNLKAAADGEHEEWTELYVQAAKTAREEGFEDVAVQFEQIAKVEKEHETRYRKLYSSVKNQTTFKQASPARWHCRNCGFVSESLADAPQTCPSCAHPQAYFEIFAENY